MSYLYGIHIRYLRFIIRSRAHSISEWKVWGLLLYRRQFNWRLILVSFLFSDLVAELMPLKALVYHFALWENVKSAYSLLLSRVLGSLSLHLAVVGGVLVCHGRLVRHEHGRRPEHVAEGVVQQVQDGRGVQVRIPKKSTKPDYNILSNRKT